MNLRQALIEQSPSLALQRAAADEIARLDAQVAQLKRDLAETQVLLESADYMARGDYA